MVPAAFTTQAHGHDFGAGQRVDYGKDLIAAPGPATNRPSDFASL